MTNKDLLINHLKISGKDKSWEDLAKQFNLASGEIARKIWLRHRSASGLVTPNIEKAEAATYIGELEDKIVSYEEDIKAGSATVAAVTNTQVKSLGDLISICSIDTSKWKVSKYTQSAAGNRYNVKAWLEPNRISLPETFESILSNYESKYTPIDAEHIITTNEDEEESLLILSLADLHLDKRDYLDPGTAQDKATKYAKCLDSLVTKAIRTHNVNKILFVIGNDFFHTDNIQGQTTNGTPQDTNTTWHKAYEIGFDLMVHSINFLRQCCSKLDVMLVNGNHSFTKEFYMAHALKTYFKPDTDIQFDISPIERKVYTYGENFFGLAHGNCKRDKLPLTFSTENYKEWGACRYKEILLGDKHTDRQTSYVAKNEFSGVQVRELPSLSGTDKWHYTNQYVENIQRGVALLYSPSDGKIAELYKNMN